MRQKAPASTTLIYGTGQEPDTLNRLLAQLVSASDILAGVVEPLVRSDAHDNIIPDLAASYNISRDNLTYTFHLRHGVRWADGAPFTAKDVLVDLRHQDVSTIFGPNGPQFTKTMTGISYAYFNGNDPDDSYYWNSAQIPTSPTGAGRPPGPYGPQPAHDAGPTRQHQS